MTITRAEVADLQPGDVVEVVETCCGDEITTRGPVRRKDDYLNLGDFTLVRKDGEPASWFHSLTVVSRAPRPLYVNHDRTEPVPGDVVRDADSDYPDDQRTWMVDASHGEWFCGFMGEHYRASQLPTRLRLLVDGETGLPPAVQS